MRNVLKSKSGEDLPDLQELEERLNEEVNDEFFEDPRRFHTLHRVIDVLGMQLVDDMQNNATKAQMAANNTNYNLDKNQQKSCLQGLKGTAASRRGSYRTFGNDPLCRFERLRHPGRTRRTSIP